MRIILSNYRYFISGGPERYLFSIKDLFDKNGIDAFPFSVKSPRNIPTEWEKFFLSPMTSDDSVYFYQYGRNFKTLVKTMERNLYSPEGFFRARRYAKEVKPDLVYSLHFMNKMSPSIIDGFKSAGIPVIVRLSDFGLICPQQLMIRGKNICELCVEGSILNCVRNKCVYGSYSGSLLKAAAISLHRLVGSISRIDAFVCPSTFTKEKYVQAGFPEHKIHYIPPFVETTECMPHYTNEGHILYFGRISEEKGVRILLEAYQMVDIQKPRLIVIGDIEHSDYSCSLKEKYGDQVQFMDFIPKEELYQFVQNTMFVVVPSICYDNMPNVVLESFAHGKAVIASNHGSFPEIIDENHTGLLFEPGDACDLAERLKWAISHPDSMVEMGRNAREHAEKTFSPDLHLRRLLELFETFV